MINNDDNDNNNDNNNQDSWKASGRLRANTQTPGRHPDDSATLP